MKPFPVNSGKLPIVEIGNSLSHFRSVNSSIQVQNLRTD